MITHQVSQPVRDRLSTVYDQVITVAELNSNDAINLDLLCRPELGITFTKIFIWKLTQYKKCVFLDADTLVLTNVDELFERDELSAAPDVGWPDCFNSGVFVCVPNMSTFAELVSFSESEGSFDGGDQGLLNMYFNKWSTTDIHKHLPFVYNLNANATYFYAPAYKRYGKDAKIVHFIGSGKPWMWSRDADGNVIADNAEHLQEHLKLWWACHDRHAQSIDLGDSFYPVKDNAAMEFKTEWREGFAVHTVSPGSSGFSAIEDRLNEAMGGKQDYESDCSPQEVNTKVPAASLQEELEALDALKKKPEE
eukprot:CFRG2026T1